ncbi:hypothetical protein ACLK1S_08820 [Escherichia coli]
MGHPYRQPCDDINKMMLQVVRVEIAMSKNQSASRLYATSQPDADESDARVASKMICSEGTGYKANQTSSSCESPSVTPLTSGRIKTKLLSKNSKKPPAPYRCQNKPVDKSALFKSRATNRQRKSI